MANEKRLIDANALMDDVEMDGALYACLGAVDDVRFLVDSQPTVDAVEVVRCKDCRKCHIYKDVITNIKQYKCYLWNASREVDADSFCDAGERWMPLPEMPKGE